MDRVTHFHEYRQMIARTIANYQANDLTAAGETVWGALVHALSAGDPEHENIQAPPNQPHNLHAAPYSGDYYREAANRANLASQAGLAFTPNDAEICITSGQKRLHNHFYHANLPARELVGHIAITWGYADRLATIAAQGLKEHLTTPAPAQE